MILGACQELRRELGCELPSTRALQEKDPNLRESTESASYHIGARSQLSQDVSSENVTEGWHNSARDDECQLLKEEHVEILDLTDSPQNSPHVPSPVGEY